MAESEQIAMHNPCLVEFVDTPILNAKELPNFNAIMEKSTAHVSRMQQDAAVPETIVVDNIVAVTDGSSRKICTESQLTFTVPPSEEPFHVRFRLEVNGKREPWENPLTWSDGYFFSPRLRGPIGNCCLPPSVILSADWEKANIDGKWTWQEQVSRPQEGELRMFTLAGLLPSVETAGISGWLVGKAGQGLYGTRTVELQFASAQRNTWEDVPETDWKLFAPLRYRLPSVDVGTAALTLALNWCRCVGVQKMQEALVGELGRKNRKANLRMVHDFAQDAYERLIPVWHSSVEPWLAQNPTLAFLVAERRDQMIRKRFVDFLQILKYRGFIQGVPPTLTPLRPTLLSLKCAVQGGAVHPAPEHWMELPVGQEFTLVAEATPTNATGSPVAELKLWWLVPQANEPGLDMTALIGPSCDMIAGPGGRLRLPAPQVVNDVSRSELHLPGRNRWGNPMVEVGTEFVVRVIAEEPRSHEDDYKDVRVRVVKDSTRVRSLKDITPEQLVRSASASSDGAVTARSSASLDGADEEDAMQIAEAPYRRTAPRVWGLVKPSSQIAEEFATKLLQCGNSTEAARAVLETLGCTPTQADIADVIATLDVRGTVAEQSEQFRQWYKESVFGNSLLSEGWSQFQSTMRKRRNKLLAETLEIPRDKWGFKDDEWGGVIPEVGLMQQHLACVTKKRLASVWLARDAPKERSQKEIASDAHEGVEGAADVQGRTSLKLDDSNSVEEATLLAVTEALVGGMLKQYMSKLLPTDVFGEDERKAWVENSVEASSLSASAEQLLTYRLAGFYRTTLSEESVAARDASDARAAAREAEATKWMEAFRTRGTEAGNPPEGVNLAEVVKVVAKTVVKQEVTRFMEGQMVPLVKTQLRDHIVPAAVDTLKSMAFDFFRKRWMSIFALGFSACTVCTFGVVGPWVAVFILMKRQNRMLALR